MEKMGKGFLEVATMLDFISGLFAVRPGGRLITPFSLLSELPVSYLEPELQDTIKAKYREPVPYVYFNKGL